MISRKQTEQCATHRIAHIIRQQREAEKRNQVADYVRWQHALAVYAAAGSGTVSGAFESG